MQTARKQLQMLRGHGGAVNDAVFSLDGLTIATASDDATVRLWDAKNGRELQVLRGHESAVRSVRFSPDGKTLVTASEDGTARLWSCGSADLLRRSPTRWSS